MSNQSEFLVLVGYVHSRPACGANLVQHATHHLCEEQDQLLRALHIELRPGVKDAPDSEASSYMERNRLDAPRWFTLQWFGMSS